VNLVEPWILLRLLAGLTAAILFVRAAMTSLRVVRHFDVSRATEGQLALEKQAELGSAFLRAAAVIQVGTLVLSILSADRLSHAVRGAMCAYGVFRENRLGFPSLITTGSVAFVAGVVVELMAFDRSVRGMDLIRPIAILSLLIAPLATFDLALSTAFFMKLDLGVTASCCSVALDAGPLGAGGFASGPRELASVGAVVAVIGAIGASLAASARPRPPRIVAAALLTVLAVPLAIAAVVLEVAPHAFELPQHACPFCLLRADVWGIGYPLLGAIFLAAVWSVGTAAAALVSRRRALADVLGRFARSRLRMGTAAWVVALALGLGPVLRYAIETGGKSLFP
jgi:hypothetical protein